jgi:putative membrane protein
MSKEVIQRFAACLAMVGAAIGVAGCGPSTTLLAAATATPTNSADPPSAADRAFVAMVSQGGAFEVLAGQLAVRRGNTQDIRDQGATEAHDHQIVGDKLKAISAAAGIPIADALNAQFQHELDDLKARSGTSFDVTYLREMDEIHRKDGAAFATEARSGSNRALREFAAETRRIVQRHLGELHASGAAPN